MHVIWLQVSLFVSCYPRESLASTPNPMKFKFSSSWKPTTTWNKVSMMFYSCFSCEWSRDVNHVILSHTRWLEFDRESFRACELTQLPIWYCLVTKLCPTVCDPTDSSMTDSSLTISWNLLKFISIESVKLSKHLILCCPFPTFSSNFPSIRVFSNDSCP